VATLQSPGQRLVFASGLLFLIAIAPAVAVIPPGASNLADNGEASPSTPDASRTSACTPNQTLGSYSLYCTLSALHGPTSRVGDGRQPGAHSG
jgi:hypothetical protein